MLYMSNFILREVYDVLSSLAQVGVLGISMGAYVESQWGVAQFSLPAEAPRVCAFVGDKKSVVGEWKCN